MQKRVKGNRFIEELLPVKIPIRFVIEAVLIGFFEGALFLAGEAASKEYGFWQAFALIVVLNILIFLVMTIRYKSKFT